MPAKAKRGKAQAISLNDFNGPIEAETNDWAEDPWVPEEGQQGAGGNKPGLYGHGINKHLGDFRSEDAAYLSTVVPEDMEPPYTAHVGNLAHGITEEEVKEGFFPEEIVNIRIIKTKATFAFVEFAKRENLQNAILLSDKYVKGRPIKVDVATKQQQERMMNQTNAENGKAGGGFAELSRDAIGSSEQPSWNGDGLGGGRRGRQEPREPAGELSRDVFGGTQQVSAPSGEREGPRGGFGGGFGDFDRDQMGAVKQPEFKGFGEGRRGRGTPKASPNTSDAPKPKEGGFGNWRDEAPAAQPKKEGDAPKREGPKKDKPAPKKEEKETKPAEKEETSSWRSGVVKQPEGRTIAAAPTNAWGKGAVSSKVLTKKEENDRFGDLRK